MRASILVLTLTLAACGSSGSSSQPSEPGALQVTSVSPPNGTMLGGTRVTLKGSGFSAGVTAIRFDGVPATEVDASGDTTVHCTTPANDAGYADVTVETNAGSATLVDGYDYNSPPRILAIAPPAGFAGGALTVSIIGLGFQNAQAGPPTVYFGDQQSFAPQVVNDTLIFATTPPQPAGLVDVTVINANGEDTLENGFLYYGGGGLFKVRLEDGLGATITKEGHEPERWSWPDLLRGLGAWSTPKR